MLLRNQKTPVITILVLFFVIGEASPTNVTTRAVSFTSTSVIGSTVTLALVMALALLGNTLVCVAFYRSTNLHSVTNVFIVSLAITDILVAVVSIPIWLVIQNTECINNATACDSVLMTFWRCLDILFSTASIMNLCAISCDRYIAITSPLRYAQIITKTRSAIVLIFLWAYSIVTSSISLAGGVYYPILVFVVSFLLPLTVMFYSYLRIFLAALRQLRRIQPIRQAFYYKREIKAAKTLAMVMGIFIVCWTPFFVTNILVTFYKGLPVHPIITLAIKLLHYSNSALNPIIYSSTNRDFRNKILRVLPWRCGSFHSYLGEAVINYWASNFRANTGIGSMAYANDSITDMHDNESRDEIASVKKDRFTVGRKNRQNLREGSIEGHPHVISCH